jgi:hypothetical protein
MAVVFDRFRESDEVESVVGCCGQCGDEIRSHEEVVDCEGELFCDDGCLLDWFKSQVPVRYVTGAEAVMDR